MPTQRPQPGQLKRAPENFIAPELSQAITEHGLNGERRQFLRSSFLAAIAAGAATGAASTAAKAQNTANPGSISPPDDPAILNLPAHSKTLGQAVATHPYGQPSRYESALQRRESPGLTRVGQASVSFTPLQGLFGIITPSGL
ncbi:MAG: sulfite oxidase molybdopterin subunit, partial [Pseudomonadota bacterium]